MKSTIIYLILAACVLWTMVSCTAFTAPKNEHGIRQDAPPEWEGTPDPRDTPETLVPKHPSQGNFGHEWLFR